MELKIPSTVISQVDVARLMRELNGLDDFFVGAEARSPGTPMKPPRLSRLLDTLAKDNQFNLLEEPHRKRLGSQLNEVIGKAPLLHMSFASEPSPKALEKILGWLRQNIHPYTLLQVGLQPTIAAGCVLRTPNKVIDMSLRNNIKKHEGYLVKLIEGSNHER